ncbi:alpha-E domain-containing protein [Agrobacterium tumefaciens]|uniref:Alpha-E domain-containing protein n=1 Tax=Agrobacterium tumefaciens TaxID=358 RepID=A0A4D7YS60_AGRTU|nr:alpha-E domain-containing protein [Agrobacterium tumefaciens]QCL97878.1 alpha-E domain-containing protein [Agrobacterium tumefaciens]
MLLGRTASGLYWMHRYIERAENIARIIDAGLRMALTSSAGVMEEWKSVVICSGTDAGFREKYTDYTAAAVTDYLLRDVDNPSSVLACIEAARSNGRMVRTALTREVWETLNEIWMSLKVALSERFAESELPGTLDRIKREMALIRGTFHGTMLRNEIFDFASIGTFIERADNTARILDVKYHVLLPSVSAVGSALDNLQWESILRSVSAHRSYRWVYDGQYKSRNVADYLILNGRMPRSLQFCYRNIVQHLSYLSEDYGIDRSCHHVTADTLAMLKDKTVDQIFELGLHEFLTDFIKQNNRLGNEITENYNFT